MRVRPMCWLDVIDLRAKKRDTCSVCSSWLEGTTWRTECRRHAAKRQWPLPPAHESLPYVLYFITEAPGMAAAVGERGEANQSVVGDRRSTTDEVAAPMPAAGLPPMA